MTLMLALAGGAVPRSLMDLLRISSTETKIVLVICAIFSIASWFLIGLKWWQFRRLHQQGDRFFRELERTTTRITP